MVETWRCGGMEAGGDWPTSPGRAGRGPSPRSPDGVPRIGMGLHVRWHLTHLTRGMDHGGVIFGRWVSTLQRKDLLLLLLGRPLFFTWQECEGIAGRMRRNFKGKAIGNASNPIRC